MDENVEEMTMAEKRREMRRRRILMNSEDRMKKLMGQPTEKPAESNEEQSPGTATATDSSLPSTNSTQSQDVDSDSQEQPTPATNAGDSVSSILSNITSKGTPQEGVELLDSFLSSAFRTLKPATDRNSLSNNHTGQSLNNQNVSSQLDSDNQDDVKDTSESDARSFYRLRQFLCFFIGILVRLSLLTEFGEEYVQTMVYPFAALQIAVVGYQRAVDMDIAANFSSNLWVTALMLAGMKQEFLATYKQIMGGIYAAADDFAVYFFAFMITHLVV